MRKIILAGLLSAAAACAQGVSIGVLAGAPFNAVVSGTTVNNVTYISQSPKFTVGGAFQLNLPLKLRVEVDALFRPASFSASSQTANTSASEWRFPLILQYRLATHGPVRPFIGVGTSFEHLYQIKNAVTSGTGSIASNSPGGMLINAGIDFKAAILRVSIEGRYTRQFNTSIENLSDLNQTEVLLGLHF